MKKEKDSGKVKCQINLSNISLLESKAGFQKYNQNYYRIKIPKKKIFHILSAVFVYLKFVEKMRFFCPIYLFPAELVVF